MKLFLISFLLILFLKKNFRSKNLIQKIVTPICNFTYYAIQYLLISPLGFILNLIKLLTVYIKDDVVHGKKIYKRSEFKKQVELGLPDPNPDDTCPNENSLF